MKSEPRHGRLVGSSRRRVSVIDTARRPKLAEVAVGKLPWSVVMR